MSNNTQPFGSTRDIRPAGTILLANATFPSLEAFPVRAEPMVIGPDCAALYTAPSLFNISAMSYGAISGVPVLALSNGARMAGCWMNTGEGGLSLQHLSGGADLIFQIGQNGVRNDAGGLDQNKLRQVAAHSKVRMVEIKLSQGAKPGKGGILPAAKVTAEIAAIRGIPIGKTSHSPSRQPSGFRRPGSPHHRQADQPTSFKLVLGEPVWLDDLCDEIHRRGIDSSPDFITVDSGRWRNFSGAREPDGLRRLAYPGEPASDRR